MGVHPDRDEISGFHVLVIDKAGGDRRALREALREGVDSMLDRWGWQWVNIGNGRRICGLEGGKPAPPVSISYSGPVALLLVSADWHSVGVDIEISRPDRGARYARIAECFTGGELANTQATFVRAEAWAKATDCGFIFGPSYFLRESVCPGIRRDGRLVRDIDLLAELSGFVSPDCLVAAAVCTGADAPEPVVHPRLILKSAERSVA